MSKESEEAVRQRQDGDYTPPVVAEPDNPDAPVPVENGEDGQPGLRSAWRRPKRRGR